MNQDELLKSVEIEEVKTYVKEEVGFWSEADTNEIAKSWLKFCNIHKNLVKVMEYDVPEWICPKNMKLALSDIKVFSKGPDDKVYNGNKDLREKVARGNSVLYINDLESKTIEQDCIIFALRKFTGGMGDEDEDQPESNLVWLNYFLKPIENATQIICTEKANGEAAHLSARFIKNKFYLIIGSKNVHLMIGKPGDLEFYKESRFHVAKEVGVATLNMLSKMSAENLQILLNFLHHTKSTAVFEQLQPSYQHVVDLSYLSDGKSALKFITWTSAFKNESCDIESYCSIRPDKALAFAQGLGMETVKYHVISASKAEERMQTIRKDYGHEGEVMYFINEKGNVIGLLKKKTAWYVLARAIREKARNAVRGFVKTPSESVSGSIKKTESRLRQIQTWIGFSDTYLKAWTTLATGFLRWLHQRVAEKKLESICGNFPQLWKIFLTESNQSDQISWD